MARLVFLSAGLNGRTYDLKVEKTTVGRVSDNAFEIPEASVSSHHAEIILRGDDVVIRDLDSTNGTFINGEKITEAPLKPGQTLRFGTIELRLDTGALTGQHPRRLDTPSPDVCGIAHNLQPLLEQGLRYTNSLPIPTLPITACATLAFAASADD